MPAPRRALAAMGVAVLVAGCAVTGEPPSTVPETNGSAREASPTDPRPDGPARPSARLVPVLRVVDGDTLHVLRGGRDVTIRLIGIDTPEVGWYAGRAECFGAAAGRFVMGLLDDERVRLEFDRERIDPYGRTLAYVYTPEGRFVNELLVRRGFATVTIYEPNDRYEADLLAAEARARSAGVGLWSACRTP